MTELTYIIPILIFGATLLLVLGVSWYAFSAKRHRDLLKKIEDEGREERGAKQEQSLKEKAQHLFMRLAGALAPFARPKGEKGEEEVTHLRRRFLQAGLGRVKNVVMVFYGSKVILAILLPVLFTVLRIAVFRHMVPVHLMFVIVVLALIGFYLPDLWLRIKIADRKDQIVRGFPDGLDLMVICAEAGMGLDAAINRVGEEMKLRHAALSEEFKLLSLELRAGKLRRDALKNLAMRTDSEDVKSFTTLLIQTDKFGTSIAQALRVQADAMRTRRTLKVEELAAKLPVKILFPTIMFIFPSLFLVLMGPALIRAFRVWAGH